MNKAATSIGDRLRLLMERQGIGENELARRSQVPQPTIHRILKGMSKSPRISNLEKIAASLGTTASFLAHGGEEQGPAAPPESRRMQLPPILGAAAPAYSFGAQSPVSQPRMYRYPILSWKEAKQSERVFSETEKTRKDYKSTDYKNSGAAFWLTMRGDAMSAPIGASPTLPEGTLVLFDSGLPSAPGSIVLVTVPGAEEPICRMLIEEGGQSYLKPLNPSYPLSPLRKSNKIISVAIEAKLQL